MRIDDWPPGAGGQILIGVTQGCFGCNALCLYEEPQEKVLYYSCSKGVAAHHGEAPVLQLLQLVLLELGAVRQAQGVEGTCTIQDAIGNVRGGTAADQLWA